MKNDDIKAEIQKTIDSIGALCELAGIMRESLISNGFTREEAIGIVCEFIDRGNSDE